MEEEEDIILADLDDEELVQQMFDDLYDGLKEEIEEGVNILLERKWEPYRVLTEALVGGMTIVGQDFRDGILFVPEVLLAANAMKAGMAILKALLAETGAPRVGKMVLGTVKGDIPDIGKNHNRGLDPAHPHNASFVIYWRCTYYQLLGRAICKCYSGSYSNCYWHAASGCTRTWPHDKGLSGYTNIVHQPY